MFSGYCLAAMSQFKGKKLHEKRCLSRLQISVILLIITNIPMAFYMSLFHQVSFLFANVVLDSCCSMDYFFLLLHYFHNSIYVSLATLIVAERNGRCYVLFIKRSPGWKSEECPLPHALSFNTLLLYLTLQHTYALFGLHS